MKSCRIQWPTINLRRISPIIEHKCDYNPALNLLQFFLSAKFRFYIPHYHHHQVRPITEEKALKESIFFFGVFLCTWKIHFFIFIFKSSTLDESINIFVSFACSFLFIRAEKKMFLFIVLWRERSLKAFLFVVYDGKF